MRHTPVELTARRPPIDQPPARRRGTWRRRLTAIVSFTMLATAVAVVATESTALAMPANCTTVNGGTYAQSLCTSGVGEHRVIMTQQHFQPGAGPIVCVGPWTPVGSVSHTSCAPHTVISVQVQTREPTDPGMGGQPEPPPTEPPPSGDGLDCRSFGQTMQTYIEPLHYRAMRFTFIIQYCYNNARDLVRVLPRILPPEIQLPAEEVAHGRPVGSVGTMQINSLVATFPIVTQNDPPVRTSQGQTYSGVYTINGSFTPNPGLGVPRVQNGQATIGVLINNDRAFPIPPVFIRLT
ncbi:hypothetical protein [Actinophytocola sp.]|uniref:hypothetical protein n=1 Tax=Actinophytocola sp. TaxID=1872138 RepID=UPI002D806F09|nr:hypothetical protein [Actinophytocola sp.]HET9141234.1 hypothetical protein [Actinophytocola sp.]